MHIADSILDTIGRTPLLALDRMTGTNRARVLLKLEYFAPGASMKDRIGKQIIEDAESDGRLRPGSTVVELTSGNTGIGLAIACRQKGYRMVAVMSEGNSVERRTMLRALGAELVLVPQTHASMPGKVSKEDLDLVEARAVELTRELGAFRADQFNNDSNPRAHELGTGSEIWDQAQGRLTDFVAAVGTGGLFVGVARALKARDAHIRCHVVEPERAPFLAGGPVTNTRHKIQGAGYVTRPGFWDESLVDGYFAIADEDAVDTARRLASEVGVIAGFSTGANVAAALQLAAERGPSAVIVTVAPDTGMKYLSTDLFAPPTDV